MASSNARDLFPGAPHHDGFVSRSSQSANGYALVQLKG
jgi:hypothetical protein